MTSPLIRLRRIEYAGVTKRADVSFADGVNVICGASDTGKSFLAETIDFMFGGKELRKLPESDGYSSVTVEIETADGTIWRLKRSLSGGNYLLAAREDDSWTEDKVLKATHTALREDNISGFLLSKLGLLARRVLKSASKGETISLSFRLLAPLFFVQEEEIQRKISPFLSGQYQLKVVDLSAAKLLLTGDDDTAVIAANAESHSSARQIERIGDIIDDFENEFSDAGLDRNELIGELERVDRQHQIVRRNLQNLQHNLSSRVRARRELLGEKTGHEERLSEIAGMLERFDLLNAHYAVDRMRLLAISESGSLFAHVSPVRCPLCGANPDAQHVAEDCEGDVVTIVAAAAAEIGKIDALVLQLRATIAAMRTERTEVAATVAELQLRFDSLDAEIQERTAIDVESAQSNFEDIVQHRSDLQASLEKFERVDLLIHRRAQLQAQTSSESEKIAFGLPASVTFGLSKKIEHILKEWNFPGECRVHYDSGISDFVIDGKERGSRGQGLRAITHAAVTIGILEFCRERSLPHLGFVVLDSPLLAYYKPEGDEASVLQGTNLQERFYDYLSKYHGVDSQIIIIENQHPPATLAHMQLTSFTANPNFERAGLL